MHYPPPRHYRIFDYISIGIGVLAWLLPDIPISTKIVFTTILLAILVIRPKPIDGRIGLSRLLALLFLPPLVVLIESWIITTIRGTNNSGPSLQQYVISYGFGIAMPLCLIVGLRSSTADMSKRIFRAGLTGCLFQIGVTIILFLLALFIISNETLNNLDLNTAIALVGPLATAALAYPLPTDNNLFSIMLLCIAAYFQNMQFGWLGLWISGNVEIT